MERKVQERHDLGNSGAGDALALGDLGLVPDLAGVEHLLPFLGLEEEFFDAGHLGRLGWPRVGLAWRYGADYLTGGHTAHQVGPGGIFKGILRPQGDLHGLVAVVVTISVIPLEFMDNSEHDLGFGGLVAPGSP